MDTNNMKEKMQKYYEFRNKYWTLEHVKKMTLDEFTNTTHDSFTYDVENWTRELGSIKGRNSFIFGIYKRKDLKEKESHKQYIYTKDYAWNKKFGSDINEVYENVKDALIEVIEAALSSNYAVIDKNPLDSMFKWKVAFLYQNLENITITPVYKHDVLIWDVQRIGKFKENLKTSQLYEIIKKHEKFSSIEDTIKCATDLWEDYHNDFNISNERKIIKYSGKGKNATSELDLIEYHIKAYKGYRKNSHNKLEKSFNKYLMDTIKANNITQNEEYTDFQFYLNDKKYICELKPSSNQKEIKYAIQSAIGQILRYSHNKHFDYKIIVFQKAPDKENAEFLEYLKKYHNIHYLFEETKGVFMGNILN